MALRVLRLPAPDAPRDAGDAHAIRALLDRETRTADDIERAVAEILSDVRRRGDAALRMYTERFDQRSPRDGTYEIPRHRVRAAAADVAPKVARALERAAAAIRQFHAHQVEHGYTVEFAGARLGLRVAPMARVGIYVPGGTARYPSSVLMTAIPAKLAGVGEIVMVTPGASAETLAAAELAGVDRVFEIGGAQAVAALAYGTATVPRVDKIVGPGNQWVATAKRQVYGQVDIDSVAGPSEVLIVADDSAEPRWVAADLLAQAEHDVEARAILVALDPAFIAAVDRELEAQLLRLPRVAIASQSIARHGVAVLAPDLARALEFADRYAPEHLELHIRDARTHADAVRSAGAIFVGPHAPEAAGDYLAGPNHVLPTGGAARYASPLGVHDFRKRTTIIEWTPESLAANAADIIALAAAEGLDGHGRSISVRLSDPDADPDAAPTPTPGQEPRPGSSEPGPKRGVP